MRTAIMTNNSLQVPRALIHIFGIDCATYLMVASEYSRKEVCGKFKMPIRSVNEQYGITRFKQLSACDYFIKMGILTVNEGECASEGRDYQFDQQKVNDINNIVLMVDSGELMKFKNRANKKIVRYNLDLDRLCAIVEKL